MEQIKLNLEVSTNNSKETATPKCNLDSVKLTIYGNVSGIAVYKSSIYEFDTTPKDKKTANIIIRVTEQEKQRLHLSAMELDMSVTQLIKIAVENYLMEEL